MEKPRKIFITQIECPSCRKESLFTERMIYCPFCGTKHNDHELKNAAQRLKQAAVIQKFKSAYLWGGLIATFLVIQPILGQFMTNKQITESQASLIFIVWILVWLLCSNIAPFAANYAKRKHPEDQSAQ